MLFLGPVLCILLIVEILSALAKHQSNGHLYPDDVQTLVHGLPLRHIQSVEAIRPLSQHIPCD